MDPSGAVVGIDLGTTQCVVAHVGMTGLVSCLPNRDGEVLTPSWVMLREDGTAEAGQRARAGVVLSPDRCIDGFKRQMGRPDWSWQVDGRTFSAPALSALLLRRLVEDAERIVGPLKGAVITVPAYFGDRERTATLEAAGIAGLEVIDIINEPTAAALASAFDAYVTAGGDRGDLSTAAIAASAPAISVVCDIGGGTFDVTIIRIDGQDFRILGTSGTRLGGRDFDLCIVEAMCRHLFDHDAPDPHHDPLAQAKMRLAAESVKHALTVKRSAAMKPPYEGVPDMPISREHFEELSKPLIDRARGILVKVMEDAKLEWGRVEDLLMVGGASRMPVFRRMAAEVSGLKPDTRLQPDLIVAQGAAFHAAICRVQGVSRPLAELSQAVARAYGRGPAGRKVYVNGDPVEEQQPAFDPTFAEAARSVRLSDVTSRSLGAVVRSKVDQRRVNAVMIPRNTPLPASHSRHFATREEGQRRVCVPIVEGDDRDPLRCAEIGRCIIDPLPAGLARGSVVEVTFTYDSAGRVQVRAEELSTRTAAEVTLSRAAASPKSKLEELAEAVSGLDLR